jgi:predicted phage terminase large subunit-like protein
LSLIDLTVDDIEVLDPDMRAVTLARLDWLASARPAQLPPPGDWFGWAIIAGRGFGKGLALETPVPTPTGLVCMGALTTGDLVYAPDGTTTKVLAHEPYMPRRMFRLHFSTGEIVEADGDHLWFTQRGKERAQDRGKVRDTVELFETQLSEGSRHVPQHYIPTAATIYADPRASDIHPYTLGVWLGDGVTKTGDLCLFEQELRDRVRDAEGLPLAEVAANLYRAHGFRSKLHRQGLLGNKRIPVSFLTADQATRLELLKGLMDTDGCIQKEGLYCSYGTILKDLADDVHYLVASLGFKPRTTTKLAKLRRPGLPDYEVRVWEVNFTAYADRPVFKLSRKLERMKPAGAQAKRHTARTIIKVEEIEPKMVRCLTVHHPSALYCITSSFIPTHNTRPGAEETWYYAATHPGSRCAVVAPTQSDLKKTCFEGESGLLARCPKELLLKYNKSDLELHLTNGSVIQGFSAEKPERLRGPQFHFAWCDELAAWGSQIKQNGEHGVADPARMKATWDMLMFGLRLPPFPRVLITSTPKPYPLVREIVKRPDIVKSHGSTKDNKANLAPSFYQQILQYEGTALGKQEIYAELLNPEDAGIFKRSHFRLWPARTPFPRFHYIIMSWDTAFTDDTNNDPTACSVWGVFTAPSSDTAVMLLDVWSEHINADDLMERAVEEYKNEYGAPEDDPWLGYKPVVPYLKPKDRRGRRPDLMLIEAKGSGIQLIQALSKQKLPIKAYNPGNLGKVSRAHAVSWLVARGKVWVPESDDEKRAGQPRKWVEPFLEQVCTFPMAEHDDMVDTFTQALALLRDQGWLNHVYNEDQDSVQEEDDQPRGSRRRLTNPYSA